MPTIKLHTLYTCIILIISLFRSHALNAQVNLTQGLVAYYPFTGNANDASGNGHHGQLMNGIQLTTDRFGASSSAYLFDGVDDYIKITDNGAFSTPQFSLVIWFQSASNALQNLVGKRDFTNSSGSGGSQYQFFINYAPFPGIGSNIVGNTATCNTASASSYVNTANIICHNKWYLAVVTFDGSRHKIYIDGILVRDVAAPFTGLLSCNSELRFGNWWNLDLIPFSGKMDDIRWYNRALNQQEVNALFDNFISPTSPVEFTFSQDACNPFRINFTNNTSSSQNNLWRFGDGNISNALSPSHTYGAFGTYNVELIATNSSGCQDSITKPISINISAANLITNNDTTICVGQSVTLNTFAASDFCWPVTQGLSNTNITNPIASPPQTITYYFNAKTLGNNIINNGSFTGGNSGFSSEYLYTTTNNAEGQYFIGPNPPAWNGGMSNCPDHTTGSGNMMLVNGAPIANKKVWCQSLAVTPNTNYEFSAWIQSLHQDNPAQLQFSINGIQVGNIFNAGSPCMWLRYGASWNSGLNTTATICIENKNTIVAGNDFALDDISLAPVIMQRDSITITVVPAPTIYAGNDTIICAGSIVQLSATGASNFSWVPATGLSNPSIANPIASPTTTTNYQVIGYDVPGCSAQDFVQITINPLPVFSISPPQLQACEGQQVVITASGSDTYQWYTASNANLGSSAQIQFVPASSETYNVIVTNAACRMTDTLSSIVTLNSNPIVSLSKSNDVDCSQTQSQLIANGGTDYLWSPATNISDQTISNPIVTPDKDIWYSVVVTSDKGCSTIDSIQVLSDLSKGQAGFLVPSGFTPNNDGKNDCFGVSYWGSTVDFELMVYNRSGQLLFRSTDSNKCWDGTFKGMPQPPAVYVYQVRTKSPCSPQHVYRKGTILLIR